MSSLINSFSVSNLIPLFKRRGEGKKYLYGLFLLACLMATFELGQDYVSSVLNDYHFSPVQSLSYKLFWFVFIPFSYFLVQFMDKARPSLSPGTYVISTAVVVLLAALTHLFVFSLLLYSISYAVYEQAWPLYYLLTEKLSTRLYIALSCYAVFSFIYYRVKGREDTTQIGSEGTLKSIPVKNGQKTTLVDVDEINWILSDGHYLTINTGNKEHVVLDSLKNIITGLPGKFRRIHRSTIVNIDQIEKLNSRGNGDYDVTMKCGKELRLSRNYAKPLRGLLL